MVEAHTTAEIPGWAHFPKIDDPIKTCIPLPPSHIMAWASMGLGEGDVWACRCQISSGFIVVCGVLLPK